MRRASDTRLQQYIYILSPSFYSFLPFFFHLQQNFSHPCYTKASLLNVARATSILPQRQRDRHCESILIIWERKEYQTGNPKEIPQRMQLYDYGSKIFYMWRRVVNFYSSTVINYTRKATHDSMLYSLSLSCRNRYVCNNARRKIRALVCVYIYTYIYLYRAVSKARARKREKR